MVKLNGCPLIEDDNIWKSKTLLGINLENQNKTKKYEKQNKILPWWSLVAITVYSAVEKEENYYLKVL